MPDETAGSTTRLLQKLDVPVLSSESCSKMMEFDLTDRMLCAGFQQGVKDACLVRIYTFCLLKEPNLGLTLTPNLMRN